MAEILLSNVRCSFPNLAAPYQSRKFPNAPAKFTIDIIDLPQDHPGVVEFMAEVNRLAQSTWGVQAAQIMQMIYGDKRSRCFGYGHEKINEDTLKPIDGYGAGLWINAKAEKRPQIFYSAGPNNGKEAQGEAEAIQAARQIYGGCFVNIMVRPWIRIANRGISCDILGIQFAKDGEAFGDATPDVSGKFGAVQGAVNPMSPNGAPLPQGFGQPAPAFAPPAFQPAPFAPPAFQPFNPQ